MRGVTQNRTMYNIPTGIIISTYPPSIQSCFCPFFSLKIVPIDKIISKFLLLMILSIKFGTISTNRTEERRKRGGERRRQQKKNQYWYLNMAIIKGNRQSRDRNN